MMAFPQRYLAELFLVKMNNKAVSNKFERIGFIIATVRKSVGITSFLNL